MQIFNLLLQKTTFTFIRVPYGTGDIWYHISFPSDEKRITFRMCENENNNWTIFDTKERWVINLRSEFNRAIDNFENSLLLPQEDMAQPIKAAS